MRGTDLSLNYESVSVKNKFVFRELLAVGIGRGFDSQSVTATLAKFRRFPLESFIESINIVQIR